MPSYKHPKERQNGEQSDARYNDSAEECQQSLIRSSANKVEAMIKPYLHSDTGRAPD